MNSETLYLDDVAETGAFESEARGRHRYAAPRRPSGCMPRCAACNHVHVRPPRERLAEPVIRARDDAHVERAARARARATVLLPVVRVAERLAHSIDRVDLRRARERRQFGSVRAVSHHRPSDITFVDKQHEEETTARVECSRTPTSLNACEQRYLVGEQYLVEVGWEWRR